MRIVLIGPPGAGKGTQAVELSSSYSVPHISTGEMLREEVRNKSAIGRDVEGRLAKGNLVPDELILRMVKERLGRPDASVGFLLDGFPRSVVQAQGLDQLLADISRPLSAVVMMDLEDEEIVDRLSQRRTCEGCGRTYHLRNRPPLVQGLCDCGHALSQREDDQEGAIVNRLKVYHQQTEPVIGYYRDKGMLVKVEATGSIADVRDEIMRLLDEGDVAA